MKSCQKLGVAYVFRLTVYNQRRRIKRESDRDLGRPIYSVMCNSHLAPAPYRPSCLDFYYTAPGAAGSSGRYR